LKIYLCFSVIYCDILHCNEWIEQIRRFNHPHVLFIIDDCHVAIDAVNEFVEQFQTVERARLILISRIFDPDRGGISDENFLEILKPVTVSFEINEDTLAYILKRLSRRKKIPKEGIGDLSVIIKRCEGDLHLLNFLVRAWTINKKKVSSLADVDEDLILEEVFRRYIKNSAKNIEYIICIATLSQFEIPIEARWFDSEEIIDELQKDAWVDSFLTEVDGQPIHFLQYFHSTPAKLLLQACSKKGRLRSNMDVFTFDFLKRYLSCQPINFFDLFLQLYRNERSDLQYALLDDGLPFQILLRMHNDRVGLLSNQWVFNLSRFIYAVWIWEGKKKQGKAYELLHTLLKASDDTYWSEMAKKLKLQVITACFNYLFRIDKNYIDRVIKNLNFNELGQQSSEVGLTTIVGFLEKTLKANVEKDRLNEFCTSLDFQELGKQSRNVGLSTISNFLTRANQAGVDSYRLNEFCTCLNFRDLGERSRVIGVSTIRNFLMRVQQAKVTPKRINEFCTCLDFQKLGIQSSGLGLSNIKNFIMRANNAGINSDCLNEFCTGLNFYELGRRSQDVGLPTIMQFFQIIYRSGIKKENYASFYRGLDWHKLGRALKKRGERGSYLAEFSLVIYQPLVDRTMARDFVTGMGWDYIKRLTEFYFSPDVLAAIRMLLLTKCEFTPQELTGNGIYLCPGSDIWFTSFCQRHCSSKDKRVLKSQTNFLNYALNNFKSQHKRGHLCYNSLDLKAWNILIQNLSLADSKFVETTIVPILSSFDDQTFEFLFRNSDLRNIGTFFSLFAPRKGPFTWHLSNGIDYRNIDLCTKIDKALLREVALFLFAPQFLGNKDLSEQVAQHIQKQWEIFLPQTMDADLKTVEFFLWNLLLALPSHEKLTLLPQLIVAIEKKANESPVDAESLLAMLGILHFIEEQEAQQKLSHFINTQQAIAICRRATRNPSPRLIRQLYGLMFLLPELPLNKNRELFRRGLNSLDMTLKISMQESVLSGLRAWIDTA